MKKILTLGTTAVLCALSAQAAIDIRVFSGGFLDENGIARNDMKIGIVVDTAGNGFDTGSYFGFDYDQSGSFLTVDTGFSDDLFLYSGNGFTSTVYSPVFGDGSVAGILNIDTTGLTAGMQFALIWFAGSSAGVGQSYGMVTHENFVIPAELDGGITIAPYPLGSLVPGAANQVFVPEPATSALMLLGASCAVVLWQRRRRNRAS